jgi:hypothetical protein
VVAVSFLLKVKQLLLWTVECNIICNQLESSYTP